MTGSGRVAAGNESVDCPGVSADISGWAMAPLRSTKGMGDAKVESPETNRESAASLGPPALQAGGLRLWVLGRQFPGAHDVNEGNQLRATIQCDAEGASVRAENAIVMANDLAGWAMECRVLMLPPSAPARLLLRDPVFELALEAVGSPGRLRMRVATPPGDSTPAQAFAFDLDESDLSQMVRQCDAILHVYPVRGASLARGA